MCFVLPYSSAAGAGGSSGLATGSVAAGGVAGGAATGAATGAAAALVVLAEATWVVVLYNPGYDFLYAVKSGALISSRVTGDLRSSVNRLMAA